MNLPFEVLQDVFRHLDDRRDLCRCQYVCKSLCRPAQAALYTKFTLGSIETFNKYKSTITTSPDDLSNLLKEIGIDGIPEKFHRSIISALGPLCSNIQIIRVNTATETFYSALLDETQKGHFKKLKSLPASAKISDIYIHNILAARLCSQLQELTLCDHKKDSYRRRLTTDPNSTLLFKNYASTLPNFTSLEKLTVEVHTKRNIAQFDELVDSCALLKSIDFNFIPPDQLYNTETEVDLSLIKPRPDIHTFRGEFAVQSDQSLKYIMKKFPELNSFASILIGRKNINVKDENLVVDFLEYTLEIPFVRMDGIYIDNVYYVLSLFMEETKFDGIIHMAYYEDSGAIIDNHPNLGMIKNENNATINLTFRDFEESMYQSKFASVSSERIHQNGRKLDPSLASPQFRYLRTL